MRVSLFSGHQQSIFVALKSRSKSAEELTMAVFVSDAHGGFFAWAETSPTTLGTSDEY
jgi:hypothetical protein